MHTRKRRKRNGDNSPDNTFPNDRSQSHMAKIVSPHEVAILAPEIRHIGIEK
jgi:hypothetical protein